MRTEPCKTGFSSAYIVMQCALLGSLVGCAHNAEVLNSEEQDNRIPGFNSGDCFPKCKAADYIDPSETNCRNLLDEILRYNKMGRGTTAWGTPITPVPTMCLGIKGDQEDTNKCESTFGLRLPSYREICNSMSPYYIPRTTGESDAALRQRRMKAAYTACKNQAVMECLARFPSDGTQTFKMPRISFVTTSGFIKGSVTYSEACVWNQYRRRNDWKTLPQWPGSGRCNASPTSVGSGTTASTVNNNSGPAITATIPSRMSAATSYGSDIYSGEYGGEYGGDETTCPDYEAGVSEAEADASGEWEDESDLERDDSFEYGTEYE
jgi:hypothetical protein